MLEGGKKFAREADHPEGATLGKGKRGSQDKREFNQQELAQNLGQEEELEG